MSHLRERFAALVAAAALSLTASAASATSAAGMDPGDDPVMRWLHAVPASCVLTKGLGDYGAAYWVGSAMDGDDAFRKRLSGETQTEPVYVGNPTKEGISVIGALYDARRHISAFSSHGTDTDYYGAFADTPPPHGGAVAAADLSNLTLAGNVHLGDSTARVASEIGLKTVHPSTFGATCPGYAVLELCSWNKTGCVCDLPQAHHPRLGYAIFYDDRVVAFYWTDISCF